MNTVELKVDLTDLPVRMAHLPIDPQRRIPVPWFVAWVDGKPEFRAMDARKWRQAVNERLCWTCGQRLGVHQTFVLGPMCAITKTTSEPPNHRECARWSACNCPFLSRPHMHRREAGMPEEAQAPAGMSIPRNPGAVALWTTRSYELFDDGDGKPLIKVGPLESLENLEWYAEGRMATLAEVRHSVDTGLPILLEVAEREGPKAVKDLQDRVALFEMLLPGERKHGIGG